MPTEENTNNNNNDNTDGNGHDGDSHEHEEVTFDSWLDGQDDSVKELVNKRFEALTNTVKATRNERDDFRKQLKELSGKAKEGSELRTALDEMGAKLELAELKATFVEEAIKPEIQCKNVKAAWLLAQADGFFDKRGNVNWSGLKSAAPELFGPVIPSGAGGNGRQQENMPSGGDMNTWIRTAAGRTNR